MSYSAPDKQASFDLLIDSHKKQMKHTLNLSMASLLAHQWQKMAFQFSSACRAERNVNSSCEADSF